MVTYNCINAVSTVEELYIEKGVEMLYIDKFSATPIYLQVVSQFEELIFAGVLKAEEKLPSVRTLAKEIGINPNTLQRAYMEMENQKLCISVPGSGRYVANDAKKIVAQKKRDSLEGLKEIINDAKASGSSLDEIIKMVKKIYGEAEND